MRNVETRVLALINFEGFNFSSLTENLNGRKNASKNVSGTANSEGKPGSNRRQGASKFYVNFKGKAIDPKKMPEMSSVRILQGLLFRDELLACSNKYNIQIYQKLIFSKNSDEQKSSKNSGRNGKSCRSAIDEDLTLAFISLGQKLVLRKKFASQFI